MSTVIGRVHRNLPGAPGRGLVLRPGMEYIGVFSLGLMYLGSVLIAAQNFPSGTITIPGGGPTTLAPENTSSTASSQQTPTSESAATIMSTTQVSPASHNNSTGTSSASESDELTKYLIGGGIVLTAVTLIAIGMCLHRHCCMNKNQGQDAELLDPEARKFRRPNDAKVKDNDDEYKSEDEESDAMTDSHQGSFVSYGGFEAEKNSKQGRNHDTVIYVEGEANYRPKKSISTGGGDSYTPPSAAAVSRRNGVDIDTALRGGRDATAMFIRDANSSAVNVARPVGDKSELYDKINKCRMEVLIELDKILAPAKNKFDNSKNITDLAKSLGKQVGQLSLNDFKSWQKIEYLRLYELISSVEKIKKPFFNQIDANTSSTDLSTMQQYGNFIFEHRLHTLVDNACIAFSNVRKELPGVGVGVLGLLEQHKMPKFLALCKKLLGLYPSDSAIASTWSHSDGDDNGDDAKQHADLGEDAAQSGEDRSEGGRTVRLEECASDNNEDDEPL